MYYGTYTWLIYSHQKINKTRWVKPQFIAGMQNLLTLEIGRVESKPVKSTTKSSIAKLSSPCLLPGVPVQIMITGICNIRNNKPIWTLLEKQTILS